MSSESPVRDQ